MHLGANLKHSNPSVPDLKILGDGDVFLVAIRGLEMKIAKPDYSYSPFNFEDHISSHLCCFARHLECITQYLNAARAPCRWSIS